ncbi:probable rhamnogalacturonate lyase B [Andrographis paniculata]|uniref:probable rhamnogalacturonate lyase B n=1 Tax=Andrographis paniculata TaxID=175694 RepID=UPI0021E92A2A|nr:probable rhamnogalacturonate lyase B [Andrographis paniculata]
MIVRIQYNGIDNILAVDNEENNRGYWDFIWSTPRHQVDNLDKLEGTNFHVVMEEDNQVELSFTRTWNSTSKGLPLNIDKRFIMLRGGSGFYSYAIVERLKGWPGTSLTEGRIVFKLQKNMFQYMALSDERQRIMPSYKDRENGKKLAYPEAVLLINSRNHLIRGEVDDKYQYSSDNKNNRVHGWICPNHLTGFWIITPSDEFKTGGPTKQDLTSHVGPIVLSMFFSTHYAGKPLIIEFLNDEPWKKVFGPVFIYLNSASQGQNPLVLWDDAKKQMLKETKSWPYDFPRSHDFPRANQRGSVSGQLLVHDRYISQKYIEAKYSYIGLAPPGNLGSWQSENKGYQFWTQANANGMFVINNVRAGNYCLYGWVPGYIGDYKYNAIINIVPGSHINLKNILYEPPRNGPTLWEIGIPDRTAAEFFVPKPNSRLINRLYVNHWFRQYGLWDRYTEIHPNQDLVYKIGTSKYQTDWYFAHVNRRMDNGTYIPTTWRIIFNLENVKLGNYTFLLALASANEAELQVGINNESTHDFTTGEIGKDNTIARHGIYGLYWLYIVDISSSRLGRGTNTIFLTQSRGSSPWMGIMYDYIRLEAPSTSRSM